MKLMVEWPSGPIPGVAESVTIAGSAVGLTPPTGATGARSCLIQVQTAPIRFWTDGATPSASAGYRAEPGDWIVLDRPAEVANFLAIRESSTSAVLAVQYAREDA